MQRIELAEPRLHLDLHVPSVADALREAQRLGAVTELVAAHVVMRSPGGFAFCLVAHRGEAVPPPPLADPVPHSLDQICLDIPSAHHDAELAFWAALTGWEIRPSRRAEFVFLDRPKGMPVQMLLQRLGPGDGGTTTRAHLDFACGDGALRVRARHEDLGALHVGDFPSWTVMRDPIGSPYCLTHREPAT